MVFSDLTLEEINVSFINSLKTEDRIHLQKELKYSIILDTASWMHDCLKYGCPKCASFMNRK